MADGGARTSDPDSRVSTAKTDADAAAKSAGDPFPDGRVGVIGRAHCGEKPRVDGVRFTTNLDKPCGLIAVLSGDNAQVFDTLVAHGQALTPLADFTDNRHLARADVRPGFISTHNLQDALAATQALRERLRRLPSVNKQTDVNAMTALALAETRGTSIAAAFAPGSPSMVDYPLLAGLAQSRATLEALAETGLLWRSYFDRTHVCRHCHSARLLARDVCPSCGSSNIQDISLVHHYRCGYQAPKPNFQREDTHHLICPKCNRTVRHYGVDYDVPGMVSLCGHCGETAAEPEAAFACADCGQTTKGADAGARVWYGYNLTPSGQHAVEHGILPNTDLNAHLRGCGVLGHQAPRDLAMLMSHARRVHQRYARPYLVFTLRPNPAPDLPAAERSRIYTLVADIVRDTLRESDYVAAIHQDLYILLPETPRENADRVRERLTERLREAMGDHGSIAINEVDDSTLDTVLEELRHA